MPSKYGAALRASIRSAHVRGLGWELAAVCITANLPAVYVAQVLGVTRMSLHTWFRGGAIRESKHAKINLFLNIVRRDLASGQLPAKTVREARSYLQPMCSEPLKTANEQPNG